MRPLTYILLFVLLTCVFTLAGAVTITGPRTIELSEAEAQTCAEQGGCVIVTQSVLDAAIAQIELLQRQLQAENSKRCV